MTLKAIIADMDGTVILGDSLTPGAQTTYEHLKSKGIKWLFMSNNAGSLATDLATKLNGLGIDAHESEVLNSATALIDELKRTRPGARILVIGSERLKAGLAQAGAYLVEDSTAVDIVVGAMDKQFNYHKLAMAQEAIHKGALFWATNLDASLPTEEGFKPGSGSIVAAIATAAGREPDRVFGKPHNDLAALALQRLGTQANECLVVGDRLETDILFAKNAGFKSALVLTGASSRDDTKGLDFKPDYIIDDINGLMALFH
jgi:HAD superfamily hydrolase (TIGR01450 family)